MSIFEKREVIYEGIVLGTTEIETKGPRDYENPDGLDGHLARTALYMILRKHPKPPVGPEMDPQPWILTVLSLICHIYTGPKRVQAFEDQVFKRYSRHYGFGQMTQMVEDAKRDGNTGT